MAEEKVNTNENSNEVEIKEENKMDENSNEVEIKEENKVDENFSGIEEKVALDDNAQANDNIEEDIKEKSGETIYNVGDEEPKNFVQKKTKMKKIIVIIVSALLLVFITILVLYGMNFDKKSVEKPENKPKNRAYEKKEFNFQLSNIQTKRLNKEFNKLTKYDPSLNEKIEKEKEIKKMTNLNKALKKQVKSLKDKNDNLTKQLQAKDNLLNKVEKEKEELIKKQKSLEINNKKAAQVTFPQDKQHQFPLMKNVNTEIQNSIDDEVSASNEFLPLINVAVIKGDLTKGYLQKVEKIDKKISLCRDNNNNIEIYIGPYEMSSVRKNLLNKLLKNGFNKAMLVDLTKEEFNKRCNY